MKLKRIFQPLAIAVAAAFTLTACNDNNGSFLSGPYYDFVDITSNSSSGVIFSTYTQDTNVEIELYTPENKLSTPEKYPAGSRAYIGYNVTSEVTAPGPEYLPVHLLEIHQVNVLALERTPAADCSTGSDRLFVTSTPFRTGNYVNLVVSAPDVPDRTFKLQLDESTVETGKPEVYLSSETPAAASTERTETYPISFDTAGLWDMPSVTQITVIVRTGTDGATTRYIVNKY